MTPLEELRHSTAHVLATAVLRLWPETKLDIGPPTDMGFYYDFDTEHRFSTEDLEKIADEMEKVIQEKQPFTLREVSREEARQFFEERDQPYKVSRLGDIPEDSPITFYQNGEFVDLCAGTHVTNTGDIKAFKLLSIAGAYHRGDVKNKQLQRIYGTAFPNRKELAVHLQKLEQAQKRDHRKIGQALKLFRVDSFVGSGLPLLLPRGSTIRYQLERLIDEKLNAYDYDRVYSPHIGSIELYKTSGHWPYYADSIYDPIKIEEREFLLKPMNCPMHMAAYVSEPRSYRDLPQRYAEFGTVYRQEQSGELLGLVRVRGFTQDDGHIFCTPDQLKDEFNNCLNLINEVMEVFGLVTRCRVSLRDPGAKAKYVGDDQLWQKAETTIQEVVKDLGIEHTIGLGEAAFYGPKLDFMAVDAIGRGWQLGTIQVDFNLPNKFGLEYKGPDGMLHKPVMIHRAVFGSIERFMGLLIEHFAGDFPVWMAPEQVRLLTITDDLNDHADTIMKRLKASGVRATVDRHPDKIGGKIRRGRLDKVPYLAVIGKKEMESDSVGLRSRCRGEEGLVSIDDFLSRVLREMKERTLTVNVEEVTA